MKVFDFDNYKNFINGWIRSQPKKGHGQYRRLAGALSTSSTIISQVFRGDRELTLEQASDVCDLLEFTELESEYFMNLVMLQRAGSDKLRRFFVRRAGFLKKQSEDLKARVPHDATVSEDARATFYSHWYYSGIRNLSAIPGKNTVESITARLGLPRGLVKDVVDFLVRHGLCEEKNGKLGVGPRRTHLDANSPLAARHHVNWRLKAAEKYSRLESDELAYTSPMSLSPKTAGQIRKKLIAAIEEANALMTASPSEEVYCLNVDWFKY